MGSLLAGRCGIHDPADRANELRPAVLLADQLGLAGRREPVELRPLVRFADSPLGFQPSSLHEPVQGGIQGAFFHSQNVFGRLLDGFDGNLTTSKYAKLAKCSHDTALRDLLSLVEHGIMLRNPEGGRSTSYELRLT